MASKRWIFPTTQPEGADTLAASLGVSVTVSRLLLLRGVTSAGEGRAFLDPQIEQLHDPFLLPDMQPAVERIAAALKGGEKILVHGDYDVDGVCAAALLTRVLRALKANVETFVPHRRVDGYDLQVDSVRRAKADGVRLIITVDCGIVAFQAAQTAQELGVDLIITDHHEPHPDGELPEALAVIDPKLPDSEYPFSELCGTGVAYKLSAALVQHLGVASRAFQTAFLDLVALATCADCMPLVDENRIFVKWGLETLRKTNKAGLQALMKVAGLQPSTVTARSLGFALGPRINAIGRLDASAHALTLLLTSDAQEAEMLAQRLDQANRERQQEQERILTEAMRQAERYLDDKILVLASPKWHPGIIGIVASKVADALCRPTIMIAIDEESNSARGSCRSVEGFHVFEAVNACREYLVRCGGHQAAAGFDIEPAQIEAFRVAMREVGESEVDEELLQPSVRVDTVLPADGMTQDLLRELEMLEPYGHGNPQPVFATKSMPVVEQRRLASKVANSPDHLKLRLRHPTFANGVDALFWRAWGRAEECPADGSVDVCYTLGVNEYNGNKQIQLTLLDLRARD